MSTKNEPSKDQSLKRVREITQEEANTLITELTEAHYIAGRDNDSISRSVFRATYEGSGDVMKAISAALLSIGGKHGPLYQARQLVAMHEANPIATLDIIEDLIESGEKVPGFGNSFFKTGIDPAFNRVFYTYSEIFAAIYNRNQYRNSVNLLWDQFSVLKLGTEIQHGEKGIYPNAALITGAIVQLCLGVPYIENWVFINGRSRAWIESLSLPEAPQG